MHDINDIYACRSNHTHTSFVENNDVVMYIPNSLINGRSTFYLTVFADEATSFVMTSRAEDGTNPLRAQILIQIHFFFVKLTYVFYSILRFGAVISCYCWQYGSCWKQVLL